MDTLTNTTASAKPMKRFEEIAYERPDMAQLEQGFNEAIAQFENADSAEAQWEAMEQINALRRGFDTAYTLVSIRHTVDTRDAFYEGEQNFFDKNMPIAEGYTNRFYRALLNSNFRTELEARTGKQLFDLAACQLNTFSPEVIDDMQRENELSSEYTKLMSSAKVEFEGEECNLQKLQPYMTDQDRGRRKRATEAYFSYLSDNHEQLDRIYDDLVKVRAKMATKLGYKNYVELSYARLNRTEYDAKMVKGYRELILKNVVPLVSKLRQKQKERLGVDKMRIYDDGLKFTTGNAKPKGDPEWIVNHGETMYKELSAETDEFFSFMQKYNLMDLVAKKGKAPGGYCTMLSDYQAPFIYSNFNGTSDDIDVLTHEAGHAFQVYSSRAFAVPEYRWPTYEACEIHSMSMEFFTWPWMELFFENDTDKYKYGHVVSALYFMPYGAAVDEFQHVVYENPEMAPADRNRIWREIEKKYLPERDHDGIPYLEKGGFWQKQQHIYNSPFYYIDYTLAQVCALQYWLRSQENRNKAWADYVTLCKAGGSMPFLKLVELAGLQSPFDPACMPSVMEKVGAWLDTIDDKAL